MTNWFPRATSRAWKMRYARWGALAVLISLMVALPAGALAQSDEAPDQVYFAETGHHLSGEFLQYWKHEGALMTFGYPISEEIVDPETGLTVQYFERAVFEWHPDAPEGWKVQQQLLGNAAVADLPPNEAFQPVDGSTNGDCTFFEATGHRLCFGFRDYWKNNGGLRIFGYPISEEYTDPVTGYTTQYFERARFEYHPENSPQFQVLLGLLGSAAAAEANVDTSPVTQNASAASFSPSLWPPERCRPWQLELTREESSAGAGHVGVVFQFENTSLFSCSLYGYPGMLMLDANGDPLPTNVLREGGPAITNIEPRLVVLVPDSSMEMASFVITYANIPTGDQSHEAACPTSERLLVTPPDAFDQLVISTMISPCGGDIYTSPVVAGAGGPQL